MQNNASFVSSDEVSLQILLFLRGGRHFSVHEISRALSHPMNEIWNRIVVLEKYSLIEVEEGGYKLSKTGHSLLLELGYNIPKTASEKKSRKETDGFSIHPFGSFIEFVYWIITPSILLSIYIPVNSSVSFSSLSFGWVLIIDLLLSILLAAYFIASFRKVPEYENLVVFRLGKCIGKRGPGPVLIIPVLDKPQNVDLRVKHQEVPHETCITQDNVQLDVDFVFFIGRFRSLFGALQK